MTTGRLYKGEFHATVRVIWSGQSITQHAVEHLCAGRVELIGLPPESVSDDVHVVLDLPSKRPLHLRGRMRRATPGSWSFCIELLHHGAMTEDIIQDAILAQLESRACDRTPAVLVVDDQAPVRRALGRELEILRHQTVTAATPLEAVRRLQDQHTRIETALVDLFLGPSDGLDVLAYIQHKHPQIRRVVMSAQARSCQLELAVVSGRAHAVLPKPWERDRLLKAVAA